MLTCLNGCSGLITDSQTGNLLSEHAILPAGNSTTSPDKAEITLEDLTSEPADSTEAASKRGGEAPLERKEFRFSDSLPEEPDFERVTEKSAVKFPVGQSNSQLSDEQNAPISNIKLVAMTEPVSTSGTLSHAELDRSVISDNVPVAISSTAESSEDNQLLKPIANSAKPVTTAKGNSPKLTALDLQQVSRLAVETPSMTAHESVDLSALELESNLTAGPSSSKPVPQTQSLTAAEHLSETIRLLEKSTDQISALGEDHGAESGLRLLEILRSKINHATAAQWHLSHDEYQYWQQQLDAVSVMLKSDAASAHTEDDHSNHLAAAQAIEHLEKATEHLRSMAGLRIHGGQLCSQILGFGQFDELPTNQFRPGDQALIYVEVENHSSVRTEELPSTETEPNTNWSTRLKASYVVLDADENIVDQETYPVIDDRAKRRRRDFYLHLPVTFSDLPPGDYQLVVTVQDLGNEHSADLSNVVFSVTHDSK